MRSIYEKEYNTNTLNNSMLVRVKLTLHFTLKNISMIFM